MIKIYIGDVTREVRDAAKADDNNASLLTGKNCSFVSPGVYYTSHGDITNPIDFLALLLKANELVFVPPAKKWSDTKLDISDMERWTLFYLNIAKNQNIPVKNLPDPDPCLLQLQDVRQSDSPQVWAVGCSTAHGIGVERAETFGSLVAKELSMPVSFLTLPGSSIEWAADQILRSDIRTGDIIVWGLTHVGRFPYYKDKKIHHINIRWFDLSESIKVPFNKTAILDDDLTYKAITKIHQVINFCNKIGAKIYMIGIIGGEEILSYLRDMPNFIQFYGRLGTGPDDIFLDVGTDNCHPGPKQHQQYATEILSKMRT